VLEGAGRDQQYYGEGKVLFESCLESHHAAKVTRAVDALVEAGTPFALSVVGVALLAVAGWLGAHMVFVHGAAVAPSGPKPLIERRRVQVPVQQERRRFSAGMPVGQF